jgi:hypothetical protein
VLSLIIINGKVISKMSLLYNDMSTDLHGIALSYLMHCIILLFAYI